MPVPDIPDFTLQDVVDEVNPTTDDLEDCFNDAVAAKFDPKYAIGSDNLGANRYMSEFRNYGYTGNIIYRSKAVITYQVSYWSASDNSTYFYYVNNAERMIYVYYINSSGVLSYVDSGNMNAYSERPGPIHVIDDNFILGAFWDAAGWGDPVIIWSFGYDTLSGVFATYQRFKHDLNVDSDWQRENVTQLTVNESDKFFFFSHNYYYDVSGYIYNYSYETGSYQTTWENTQSLGYGIYDLFWQNGYLHVLGAYSGRSTGTSLRSYSLNTSTGVLTLVSTRTVSTAVMIFGITGNGNDLIFLNKGWVHYCYSVSSSGVYTLEDTDSISGGAGNAVAFKASANSTIFINTNIKSLYSKRIDQNDDFVLEDTKDYSSVAVSSMRTLLNYKGKPWVLLEGVSSANEILCFEIE